MKTLATIILLIAPFLSYSQSRSIHIQYEVELIDPRTELKSFDSFGNGIDRQFEVTYDNETVNLFNQFSKNSNEWRSINKIANEVTYLYAERQDSTLFYTDIETMMSMDMSSHFEDTTINATRNHKYILGYKCYKIEMSFGLNDQTVEMWLTDKLNCGVIFPGTPLCSELVALEYTLKEYDKTTIYKAKSVDITQDKVQPLTILDGYKLIVPISEFDVSGLFEKDTSEFSFIEYPKYGKGVEQLHKDIRSLCKLRPKVKDPIGQFTNMYIDFTVTKEGKLTDIEISLANEEEKIAVLKFLNSIQLTPAVVKGEKVNSNISLMVNLNKQ